MKLNLVAKIASTVTSSVFSFLRCLLETGKSLLITIPFESSGERVVNYLTTEGRTGEPPEEWHSSHFTASFFFINYSIMLLSLVNQLKAANAHMNQ